jgi:hypothetical protein
MSFSPGELLDACDAADRISEQLPDKPQRDAVRAELDRLRTDLAEAPEAIIRRRSDAVVRSVRLLAHVRATSDAPTHALLQSWRDAEKALSAARRGTFEWLVAYLAVEYARDSYHARTDALQVTGVPRPPSSLGMPQVDQ